MAEIKVRSEIAGSVWKIEVKVGDRVAEDDPLIILELMKMEIPLLGARRRRRHGDPGRRGRADRRGRCGRDPRVNAPGTNTYRALFASARKAGRLTLDEPAAKAILAQFGIRVPAGRRLGPRGAGRVRPSPRCRRPMR